VSFFLEGPTFAGGGSMHHVIGMMAVIGTIAPHAEPTRAKSAVGG
jgi:hypothetical protein